MEKGRVYSALPFLFVLNKRHSVAELQNDA